MATKRMMRKERKGRRRDGKEKGGRGGKETAGIVQIQFEDGFP